MKIKGFGGVFWRTKDIDTLKKWYREVLNMSMDDWSGTILTQDSESEIVFSLFKEDNDYFPKEQPVMLNFQVEQIDSWIEHFKKLGVPLVKDPEKSEYGTFVWISDPEGRWIELWEK